MPTPNPPIDPPPTALWHTLSAERVLADLGSDDAGLSPEEARWRLERHGPNELPQADTVSPWVILAEQFKNVLIIILLVAVLLGAALTTNPLRLLGALLVLFLYVMTFVGFSNGVAARSKSVGGYHMLLFVLNLPLLFLSNALYPIETMPRWMQILAYLNPTTYAVDGLRLTLYDIGSLPLALSVAVLV